MYIRRTLRRRRPLEDSALFYSWTQFRGIDEQGKTTWAQLQEVAMQGSINGYMILP